MSHSPDSTSENHTPAAAPAEPAPSRRALLARWAAFAAGAALIAVVATGFIVREGEHAVVLRFGQPVRTLTAAGWYGRAPWPIDRVVRLDARLQHGELRLSEALTRDKRKVIVPMFYVWRVGDPARFLARVGDVTGAAEKLDAIVTSARNAELGRRDFDELVAPDAARTALADLASAVTADARDDAAANLGIELVDLGVLRINLPQANTESVFRRMRAERMKEAARYRAEGRATAETTRAETDKDTAILIAEARRYAEETRGRAEAGAARIYAAAHGEDVEFYAFLRQLQSLRSVIDRNTTLVLDTESAPSRLLKQGPAPVAPASAAPLLPASRPAAPAPAAANTLPVVSALDTP